MSRSIEPDEREPYQPTWLDDAGDRNTPARRDERAMPAPADIATLRATIDRATEGRPTFSEFLERLDACGVRAVPSFQKNGRLNGMSYELNGRRVKGSDLGRAYTAHGLQQQRGLRLEGERDRAALERAVRSAAARPFERIRLRPDRESRHLRDRAGRLRLYETLSDSQRATLRDIGQFRTVQLQDVIRIRYRDDPVAWRKDYERLAREKLIEQRSVVVTTHAKTAGRARKREIQSLSVVVLTPKGKHLLKCCDIETASGQALYAGFVKPREVAHDTAIYRLFQAEAARIQAEGGRVTRIVLDFELKMRVYKQRVSPKAPLNDAAAEYARKQLDAARENHLAIVDGSVRFPDLRIEYETALGEPARVDLELATEHYRDDHMATKDRAGFKIWAERASFPGAAGSTGKSPVHDDHHIEVFSF